MQGPLEGGNYANIIHQNYEIMPVWGISGGPPAQSVWGLITLPNFTNLPQPRIYRPQTVWGRHFEATEEPQEVTQLKLFNCLVC